MGLEVKLVEDCNLSCSYCYYHGARRRPPLDDAALAGAIEFFIESGAGRGQMGFDITFFGGEPLLEADRILRAIDRFGARASNGVELRYHLCTNGTLFTSLLLSELRRRNVSIVLSLDGDRATQDANRRYASGRGTFEAIRPFLPELAGMRATVAKVISPNTVEATARDVAWLVDQGFRTIFAVPDFSGPWTRVLYERLRHEYEVILVLCLEQEEKGDPLFFSPFHDKIILAVSGLSYRDVCCNMGKTSFVVDPALDIYPCTRFACSRPGNRHRIGNVRTGFDSEAIAALRTCHERDRPACRACTLRPRCLGPNCSCIAFSLTGRIDSVSPAVCEHERLLIPIADRLGEYLHG